jgi:DNA ligase (NAD+)
MDDKKRLADLKRQISQYAYEYYVLDKTTVTDAVYDSLVQELKNIEAKHPELITPDSPTQRVHSVPLDKFKKVTHSRPMISLNDVFSRDDVEAWVRRMEKLLPGTKHEYFCDTKKDGLACALIYEDGFLTQAVTRGDTKVGEDVTQNVRTIRNVPLKLRAEAKQRQLLKGRTEIRGEIVMLKKDFAEPLTKSVKPLGQPIFANPRNLSAGTIRQLDPKLVAERPLFFVGYDLLRDDSAEVANQHVCLRSDDGDLGVTRSMEASCV